MKKRLYLIGAGSFGREVESWIFQDIIFFKNYDVIGFLDFNENALSGYPSKFSVIDDPISFNFTNNDCILVCITDSESRKNIISSLKNNVEIISYISNKAIISEFVQIGLGSIICPNVLISTNVNIGNYNIINCGTQIGHDCIIGNYNSIMANVDLGGKVQIFDHVFIGTNSTIIPSRKINSNILNVDLKSINFENISTELALNVLQLKHNKYYEMTHQDIIQYYNEKIKLNNNMNTILALKIILKYKFKDLNVSHNKLNNISITDNKLDKNDYIDNFSNKKLIEQKNKISNDSIINNEFSIIQNGKKKNEL